jgi:hypothetical protein
MEWRVADHRWLSPGLDPICVERQAQRAKASSTAQTVSWIGSGRPGLRTFIAD